MKKIFLVAGESSGDIHGALLVRALKAKNPSLYFEGIGGDHMREAGVKLYSHQKELAILGILDVIRDYFKFRFMLTHLIRYLKEEKFDLVIPIDFPGFNLKVAQEVKLFTGIPVIYYISPQIWAWASHRIGFFKKYVSKVLVLFKFEEEFYRDHGVDAVHIGHPLLEIVKPSLTKEVFFGKYPLDPKKKTVCILPGSRVSEIRRLLPLMLGAAARILKKRRDVQFIISQHGNIPRDIYSRAMRRCGMPRHIHPAHASMGGVHLINDSSYNLIEASDLALVASGTATLETALLEKPMVIVYKIPLVEYLIVLPMLRVRHIGLANLVAGKEVVPEVLQYAATPVNIAQKLNQLLDSPERRAEIKKELSLIREKLLPDHAPERAAEIILQSLV